MSTTFCHHPRVGSLDRWSRDPEDRLGLCSGFGQGGDQNLARGWVAGSVSPAVLRWPCRADGSREEDRRRGRTGEGFVRSLSMLVIRLLSITERGGGDKGRGGGQDRRGKETVMDGSRTMREYESGKRYRRGAARVRLADWKAGGVYDALDNPISQSQ